MFIIEYYTENGRCPVLDFIKNQSSKEQAKILREIDLLEEFGLSLGLPHVKKIHSYENLWEIRIKHSSNNFRIFYFCYSGGRFVLLHGIRKTTGKTPLKDLKIADKRRVKYLERK